MSDLRVQRTRKKGSKMPDGTIYVGRPTKWGNPYRVVKVEHDWAVSTPDGDRIGPATNKAAAMGLAIHLFRLMIELIVNDDPHALDQLKGKPLACWCPIGSPCHRDVLIEFANR